jgi:Fe(3+) dicitrate transport protein
MRFSLTCHSLTLTIPRTMFRPLVGFIVALALCRFGNAQTGPNQTSVGTGAGITHAPGVTVTGEAVPSPTPFDDWKVKLNHIMSEVSGTEITVTKKATVIKLDQQAEVVNNNQQELFTRAPGLLITEQHTPGQFNFSYRGLGNPQESEFVAVLMDGVPLASDWIGFPTLYYLPLPQSVAEIQVIRGGASLLYGPEPAPAVNFVMQRPAPGSPWNFYTEQIGGADGLYSTFSHIQESNGPLELRIDGGYVRSEGQRENSGFHQWQTNLYLTYRPNDKQAFGVDVHAGRFSGGDPGRLTFPQFLENEDFSPTPYNHDWVDRYSVVVHDEWSLGDNWLMQAKAWYTHQNIDSRAAGNLSPAGVPPAATTLQLEEFNNGGADLRFRLNYGEGTMFRGSTLTFGGTVYHGDAPFDRFRSTNLFVDRDDTSGVQTLQQDRNSDYQAFFVEDLIRIGKFHIVPSFRLDHESVEVDTGIGPNVGVRSADHVVPLWGIGLGNDFGHLNETYFSASSGWRPTRYFDVGSPFQPLNPANQPDPFKSLDFEVGVHGTPWKGFWYDVGLFWMKFDNRTETQQFSPIDFIIVNSGSSRHRGFEGELSYDLFEFFRGQQLPATQPGGWSKDGKETVEPAAAGRGAFADWHLTLFSNLQLLDAEFTDSSIPGQVGKTPAFAPDLLWKGGLILSRDNCFNIMLSAVHVTEQFWSDAKAALATIPAKIPAYSTLNLSGNVYITKRVKLIAGISNLTDEKYYSRVFFNGSIEPAPRRSGYAGVSVEF